MTDTDDDAVPDDDADSVAHDADSVAHDADSVAHDAAAVDTAVPADADPAVCPSCGRPFAREEYLVLHRGLAHPDELSAAERTAYEDAYAEEQADVKRFRIVALGVLVLVYFGFLFAYAVFAT